MTKGFRDNSTNLKHKFISENKQLTTNSLPSEKTRNLVFGLEKGVVFFMRP